MKFKKSLITLLFSSFALSSIAEQTQTETETSVQIDATAIKKQPSIFDLECNQSKSCEMAKVNQIAKMISNRVKENWSASQSDRELRAKVHLELSHNGEIKLLEIDQSSGDQAFDQSLTQAIYQSFPIEQINQIPLAVFEDNLKENRIMFMGGR